MVYIITQVEDSAQNQILCGIKKKTEECTVQII